MVIKCDCADKLDKSNAEHLLKTADEMIKETQTSPRSIEAATAFWKNAKNMLETIKKLPDCK